MNTAQAISSIKQAEYKSIKRRSIDASKDTRQRRRAGRSYQDVVGA
jgi:hypothetical protein